MCPMSVLHSDVPIERRTRDPQRVADVVNLQALCAFEWSSGNAVVVIIEDASAVADATAAVRTDQRQTIGHHQELAGFRASALSRKNRPWVIVKYQYAVKVG